MNILESVISQQAQELDKYKTIAVTKHLDLEYDLGHLLACDYNELDKGKMKNKNNDDYLRNLTRGNVQLLLNQLWQLPTERREEAIVVKLPTPRFGLPRARQVPRPRKLTKWEEYAKLKGIQKKKKPKLSWDEQLKKWVPLFGFKRAQAQAEKDWVLEVPQNADPMEDQFAKKAEAKTERVAKNELQRLRNIAKAKNVKVPRMGIFSETSSAKELKAAVTIAKASTASLGKFQATLPKETEAKGITSITPGASRKRKLPPVSGEQEKSENLNIADGILNKRPKINIEKAANRQINEEQIQRSTERTTEKRKAGRNGKKRGSLSSSKKPKGGKGAHKGKSSGRKRR